MKRLVGIIGSVAIVIVAVVLTFVASRGNEEDQIGMRAVACLGDTAVSGDGHVVHGFVLSVQPYAGDGPEYDYQVVDVEVTDVRGGGRENGPAPLLGLPLQVVIHGGEVANAARGDCVSIVGGYGWFACGPACDAVGFVADDARVRARFEDFDEPSICGRFLPQQARRYAAYGTVRDIDMNEFSRLVVVKIDIVKGRRGTPNPNWTWTPTPAEPLEAITEAHIAQPLGDGDCVLVEGDWREFGCGLACEGLGFRADDIQLVEPE